MAFFRRLRELFGGKPAGVEDTSTSGVISCEEALSVVYEFLDGELDGASHERVKAHFDVCRRCYPHLKLEGHFRSALQRAASGEAAPPELEGRIGDLLSKAVED